MQSVLLFDVKEMATLHVEQLADFCPTMESVPVAALHDDLTEGVKAYAEQQW